MTQLRVVGDDGDGDDGKRGPGRPAQPEFDPWATDEGHSYSVFEFYTRSTNKFDHSKDVRAAIPPTIHANVMALVNSDRFGKYKSIADFVRDAMVHRLRTINEWIKDEELARVLTIEERICLAQADEEQLDSIEELMTQYSNLMERHTKNGDSVRLAKKIAEVEDWAFYLTPPHLEQANELAAKYRLQLKMMQGKQSESEQ